MVKIYKEPTHIHADHGHIITGNQFLDNPSLVPDWEEIKPKIQELTVTEISKRLGCVVKIVKED